MKELKVAEMTPETILVRLTKTFLEAQTDEWIVRLYEFLSGQSACSRSGRLGTFPLIRLEDASHVTPQKDGQPLAFLPVPFSTGLPTVRRTVCGTHRRKSAAERSRTERTRPGGRRDPQSVAAVS